ncbi:MAG: DNA translocase FtsK [Treponema sp.]
MRTRPITRFISLMFSCLFFLLSVAITVSMSLAIFETSESQNIFLQWVIAIVAIYKLSSFLFPIILLYASIILFVPGWTKHSKATLLASPFCFFTSVAGEYSLYTFLPIIQNSTIASFVQWAIILITLLLICIEFMVAHLIAMKFFKNYKQEISYQYDVDIIAGEYAGEKLTKNTKVREQEEKKQAPKETFFSMFKFETPLESSTEKSDGDIVSKDNLEDKKVEKDDEVVLTDISSKNISPAIEEKIQEQDMEKTQNIEKQDDNSNYTHNDINNIEEIEKTIEKTLKKIEDVIKDDNIKSDESEALNDGKMENIESSFLKDDVKNEEVQNDEKECVVENEALGEANEEVDIAKDEVNNDEGLEKNETSQDESGGVEGNEAFKEAEPEGFEAKETQHEETEAYIKEELEKIRQIEATSVKPLVANASEKAQGYNIPFELLTEYPGNDYWIIDSSTRQAAFRLKSTLNEFKINVEITGIRKGPVVTMFEVLPPPGIKLAKITALQDNIALRLAAESVRIVAPIPGKRAVGIEIPNDKRSIVGFRELIQVENPDAKKMAIPIVLGKDITGEPQTIDLAQTPHLLIAGATGAGKSVCVNSIILSILYNNKPSEVKLLLVDPKIVELKLYNDIGHLLTPVITEPKKAFQALQYCICEMERRYAFLDKMKVRDIKSYNKKIRTENLVMERLPYIVIIIDEFADLMATTGKELEGTVSRLCAMSRAVGIHLVLATQRPSADVITGLIKANIPSRIAFMVASRVDSRIILDDGGADKLLGKGDMLYVSPAKPWPTRIQGVFVSEEEVERVVERVKTFGEPDYIDDEIFMDEAEETTDSFFDDESDPLYNEAVDIVLHEGKASASYIQRRLKIGYNRAARIIEEMEERGVVGPANGSKPRDILQSY